MEESVAEENHLKPLTSHGPSGRPLVDWAFGPEEESGEYVASVSVCDTSEPPALSVIHWPVVQASAGSRDVRRSKAD